MAHRRPPGPTTLLVETFSTPSRRASRAAGHAAACGSPAPAGLAPSRAGDRGPAGLQRRSTHECAATRTTALREQSAAGSVAGRALASVDAIDDAEARGVAATR